MTFNLDAFWAGLLGTTAPALAVSIVMLTLNYRTNKAIENYRNSLAEKLSLIKSELDKRAAMFSIWHQKRVSALVEVYEAFRVYLDFLRRALYIEHKSGLNMDPMWDFRTNVEKNLVFLDDGLQEQINRYSEELLLFWNWAVEQRHNQGEEGIKAVRHRLDYEIPTYLEKLRKVINTCADPIDIQSNLANVDS